MATTLSSLTNTIAVDGTGKLPSTLMPDSVVGALNYQGTWNAATNTPHIQNGTGTKGHYYKVATQGTTDIGGINFWNLGDVISYNGTTWDRIDGGINEVVVGPQGPAGPPGPTGQSGNDGAQGPAGQTLYSWFAYANDINGSTNFTTGTWTNQTYLGLAVNKTSPVESTNPADYTWSKMQGPPGAQGTTGATGAAGAQGNSLYTWIAYANSANGSTDFTIGAASGHLYIGIANNKTSATESTNPADYTWSLIKGEDGVPGSPGADGQSTYIWFAYANSADGTSGFTTGAWTNQTYLGLAANKLTSVESTNPADYTWSKMQGDPGPTGNPGADGAKSITLFAFRWSNSGIPAHTQAFTYTWSGGSISAYPAGWTASAPASPGTGYTLYMINLVISDAIGAVTTAANWSTATTNTVGYREDGSIGPQGDSHRTAYVVNTNPAVPGAVTPGVGDVVPTSAAGTWSFNATSILSAGQYMYQVDGKYSASTNTITWGNPYLSNLKVGSLSAISADLGVVNISSTGALTLNNKTYGSATDGVFLGYSGGYKFDVGNSTKYMRWDGTNLAVGGDIIATGNIQASAVTSTRGTNKSNNNGTYQQISALSTYTVINNSQVYFPPKTVDYDAKYLISGSFWPRKVALATTDFDWEMQIQKSDDGVNNWISYGTWYWRQPKCQNGDQDLPFIWSQDETSIATDLAYAQSQVTYYNGLATTHYNNWIASGEQDYIEYDAWQTALVNKAYWENQVTILSAQIGVNRPGYYMRLVCKHTSTSAQWLRGFAYTFTEYKK